VLFVKIENDGFGLGAQRRPIDKNDLPEARRLIESWLADPESFEPTPMAHAVERARIGENGEWNLSGERYQLTESRASAFDLLPFQKVCTLEYGASLPKKTRIEGPYPVLGSNGVTGYHNKYLIEGPAIVVGRKGSAGEVTFVEENCYPIDTTYYVKRVKPEKTDIRYLYHVLKTLDLTSLKGGAGIPGLNRNDVYQSHKIPLPPIEVQKEIVAEIEGYQKIIDGARLVVENYQPRIPIDPSWPLFTLDEAPFQIIDGDRGANYPSKEDFSPTGYCLFLNTKNVRADGFKLDDLAFISEEKDYALRKGKLERGDVLLTTRGTIGNTAIYDESVAFDHVRINSGMLIFRPNLNKLSSHYLFLFFQSENFLEQKEAIVSGAAQPQLPIRSLKFARIPVPPIETQQSIVSTIQAEQRLVDSNKELIRIFEEKIRQSINRVWGDAE